MKEIKLYISAGIFIVLTAIKLLSPQAADVMREYISDALEMEKEQTQAIIALGTSLTKEGIKEGIYEVFDFLGKDESVEANTNQTPAPTMNPIPEPTPAPTPTASPEPTPTPTPEPTTPPKVAAFFESQEEFSEYEVPSDVSYELFTLPFEYTSPVKSDTSSGFGYRVHPISNEVKYHYGTDFAVNTGEKVHAFADGKIYACGECDSYGKYVIIDHADGCRTLYAHCSELLKGSGKVKMGDVIALSGATGAVTGPHLHFELMKGNTYLNPEFYI